MQTHNIEKSKTPVPRKSLLAVTLALAALAAQAEVYIFDSAHQGDQSTTRLPWGEASTWSPAAVPGANDSVHWYTPKTGSHRIAYATLDNNYEVGYITNKWRSIDLVKDGSVVDAVTFTVNYKLGSEGYTKHVIGNGVKLIVPESCTYITGRSDDECSLLTLASGSAGLISGSVQSHRCEYMVKSGSVLLFAPVDYQLDSQSKDIHVDTFTVDGGLANFARGLSVTADSTSISRGNTQIFNHKSGTVSFGGDFSSALPWAYTWSAGSLNVVSNSAFGANVALIVPASSSVALDVASGKTFAVANFAADSTATITKTGAGTFVYAPTTAAIAVNEGGIGFASASTYDLSNVTFGSDTIIALNALGATISAISATTENAKFVADLSGATAGTAVLNSANSAVLEKAKADLEEASAVPAGFGLQISNGVLSLEVQSEFSFVGTGSTTNILDVAGWGGTLPPNGADVAIDGEGVVATLQNGDSFPAWNSIEVKNGATLRIESSTALIPIELNKSASLEIASGVTVSLSSASDLSGIAVASQVPVLSIESGATLNVPGGMKFSNVNISLNGTLTTTSEGGITFGYAAAGDTTYIGLQANNGTISLTATSSNIYDVSPLEFCCPAEEGSVITVDDLTLSSTSILPVYIRSEKTYYFTESYKYGFHAGINNPEVNAFEVVFDNTKWGVAGRTIIKGGATFRLRNSAAWTNYESNNLWDRWAEISESGRLIVGSGCEFRLGALGDWGNKTLKVEPSTRDHQSIVVEEGGIFECYRTSGNAKGILSVNGNATYRIYKPWTTNDSQVVVSTNIPFAGLRAVNVAEGKTLTMSTRNKIFWEKGEFDNASGDRVVALADVPITGAGSIALSNANANVFGVIVQSGANIATGTASVVAPTEGEGATTLYFADGANWAGTVVAGNVALTNLVDAAAASTNAFGTLDLVENFPVRVWTDENGSVVSHDGLNVGAYVKSGGKLELVVIGEPLAQGFSLGTIGEESPLPDVQGPWTAKRDKDGNLLIKPKSGMQVFVL